MIPTLAILVICGWPFVFWGLIVWDIWRRRDKDAPFW